MEAWGEDRRSCLEAAVRGAVATFARTTGMSPVGTRGFRVAAPGDVEALVGLLEEVVYIVEVHRVVPVGVRVTTEGAATLEGVFDVVPLGDVRVVGAAPKAVSWHGARLEAAPSGRWRGHVVLDV